MKILNEIERKSVQKPDAVGRRLPLVGYYC